MRYTGDRGSQRAGYARARRRRHRRHIRQPDVQVPLAVGWWAVSRLTESERGAAAGRDLLRAQISAVSWTYAFKYAVNRERPNGDPRSFPSGHASATFATAMVLQEHYGWKIGVPVFAAAAYTAGLTRHGQQALGQRCRLWRRDRNGVGPNRHTPSAEFTALSVVARRAERRRGASWSPSGMVSGLTVSAGNAAAGRAHPRESALRVS